MNIYIENNDPYSTLTTYFYCSFWQGYAAEIQGHRPYYNWPRGKSVLSYDDPEMFSRIPNMYNWYFIQPHGELQPDEVRTWNTDVNTGIHVLMGQPLSVIREFYQRNLIFNDATNARGKELVSKYNIDFSKTIGITWRGTDIYLESLNGMTGRPRMAIETYFPFIDDVLNENPDFRIMCTAEEEKILDPLLVRYPNAFKVDEFLQAPHGGKDNPERHSKVRGYERGLQPVLMVWLFSKCAHYIKNRASTAAVASWLSNGRIVSLGHPETLGFYEGGKPFKGIAEINGVEYPLYR